MKNFYCMHCGGTVGQSIPNFCPACGKPPASLAEKTTKSIRAIDEYDENDERSSNIHDIIDNVSLNSIEIQGETNANYKALIENVAGRGGGNINRGRGRFKPSMDLLKQLDEDALKLKRRSMGADDRE